MRVDATKLRVLAAFLDADEGALRFRDRLQIERCLYRIAAAAAADAGIQLLGLDGRRNAVALARCRRVAVRRIVLNASALKSRVAAVGTVDAYAHSNLRKVRREKSAETKRLALALHRLSADALLFRERRSRLSGP